MIGQERASREKTNVVDVALGTKERRFLPKKSTWLSIRSALRSWSVEATSMNGRLGQTLMFAAISTSSMEVAITTTRLRLPP